jgi:hypothetical protein
MQVPVVNLTKQHLCFIFFLGAELLVNQPSTTHALDLALAAATRRRSGASALTAWQVRAAAAQHSP